MPGGSLPARNANAADAYSDADVWVKPTSTSWKRLAAIVGPACFLWGAAGGHIYEMVAAGNYAPGNAGIIFFTDIFIPIIGFILLWMQRSAGPVAVAPAGYR